MRRRILVNSGPGGPSPDGITYKYVDMGLSVKWATFDIGATKVGEYGKFFQWGDIQGYTSSEVGEGEGQKYFYWTDYKYCNGSSQTLTKYNNKLSYGTVDNKTVLESSDDAATFNMGKGWRMPTKAEYQELMNACNQTYDAKTRCLIYTLKTDSTKVIVFPTSGYAGYGVVENRGNWYYAWTSEVNTDGYPNGGLDYYVASGYSGYVGNFDRHNGTCVRGVWPKQ